MRSHKPIHQSSSYIFIPVLLVIFFTLSYCTEKQHNKTEDAVEDFKGYVNTQVNNADNETEQKWEDIEKTYAEKKAKADAHADKLEADAKEGYRKAVNDWEQYREKASERQQMRQAEKDAKLLRSSLVPAGIDTDLKNITGANIASVYEYFFSVVEKNKETYSKEQWVNINNYWQSLNDVKERLDQSKAISKEDNKTIRGIKSKYATTKALNKPFAEAEKNIN